MRLNIWDRGLKDKMDLRWINPPYLFIIVIGYYYTYIKLNYSNSIVFMGVTSAKSWFSPAMDQIIS